MKLKKPNLTAMLWFFLLLAASLKDDSDAIATSAFWSELAVHPAIAALKANSQLFLALAAVAGALSFGRARPAFVQVSGAAFALLLLSGAASLRASFFGTDSAVKLLQASLMIMFILASSGNFIASRGIVSFRQQARNALYLFSAAFVVINTLNFALGYGFVPGNPRFFGTSSHPNFIGVQLAICNIVVASRLLGPNLLRERGSATAILLLVAGLTAQFATGSRTALIVLFIGLGTLWLARRKYKPSVGSLISLVLFALICSYVFFTLYGTGEAYSRGESGDTRTAAWFRMLQLISVRPWLGQGYFTGNSENSYLRAMAAFGIPYGLMLLALAFFCVYRHLRLAWSSRHDLKSPEHLQFALLLALLAGSMLEAYLTDSWSLPKLVFILLTITALPVRKSAYSAVDTRAIVQRPDELARHTPIMK